jgi:hypothetical protein
VIGLREVEIRTAKTIIVKARAVPAQIAAGVMSWTEVGSAGSSSNPNVRAAEAAHMTAKAAHMTTPATPCLRAGRKQTPGQQGARQDYHCLPLHNIILSELCLLFRAP